MEITVSPEMVDANKSRYHRCEEILVDEARREGTQIAAFVVLANKVHAMGDPQGHIENVGVNEPDRSVELHQDPCSEEECYGKDNQQTVVSVNTATN